VKLYIAIAEDISIEELKHQTLNTKVRARKWLLDKIEELETSDRKPKNHIPNKLKS